MARRVSLPRAPAAFKAVAERLRPAFARLRPGLAWPLAALGRLRKPVARFGPLVLLWLAGTGLILAEFLTYREIVAVTVVPPGGITQGGSQHGYAVGVIGLASLPMSFGAVVGRSRPAAAAVAVLGALALAIIAVFDVPSLDETGLIGRTYDLAEANPGPGFWLEVACAGVLLIGGCLLLRRDGFAARAAGDPPAGDPPAHGTPTVGARSAGTRRPTRPG